MRSGALVLIALALLVAGAGCGGEDTPAADPTQAVTPEIAKKWPENWCRIEPGATGEEIQEVMGPPSEEYTADNVPSGFEAKMIWNAYAYEFTAFFNTQGRARSLQINDSALSPEQRSGLKCDKARTLE